MCGTAWFGGLTLALISVLILLLLLFIVLVLLQQPWRFVIGLLSSGARQSTQPACLLPSVLEPILGPRHSTA